MVAKRANTNCQIYCGRQAGKELRNSIRQAKSSVKIVSPYVSNKLLLELRTLYDKGLDVQLIFTDQPELYNSTFKRDSLSRFKKSPQPAKLVLKWGLISAFLYGLYYGSHFLPFDFPLYILYAVLVVIGSILLYFGSRNTVQYKSRFPFLIHDRKTDGYLIHSKFYLIDNNIAYLGSLNFTQNGLTHNHETAIASNDPKLIEELNHEFQKLYEEISPMNLTKIGQQI